MNRSKLTVLASGEGTTTEAYVRAAVSDPTIPQVELVICNKKDAGIFARIDLLNKELGLNIRTVLINSKTHPDTSPNKPGTQTPQEEHAIIDLVKAGNYDLVVLVGYMKMVGPKLVHEFGWRPEYTSPYQAMMLNTHPGLLPDTIGYIGIHIQEQVLSTGRAGHTLHVVSEKYDEGPIVAEHKVEVKPDDSAETLFARVQASEKEHLPKDIADFIDKRRKFLENEK